MNEDLKIIQKGDPQFDIATDLVRHLVEANRQYTGDSHSLVDVLEGLDDLITTAVSMLYENLSEAVTQQHEEDEVILPNAQRALVEAKRLLLRNLELNLFPLADRIELNAN